MREKIEEKDLALIEEIEKPLNEERQVIQDTLNLFQRQLDESLAQIEETLNKLRKAILG